MALSANNAVGQSPSGEPHQEHYEASSTSEPEKSHSDDFQWWRNDGALITPKDSLAQWLMAVFGILAVVVSGVAVLLVASTLKVARDTLAATQEMTRETIRIGEAQTRAYLTPITVNFFQPEMGANVLAVSVIIRNFGQSPAKQVSVSIDINPWFDERNTIGQQRLQAEAWESIPAGVSEKSLPILFDLTTSFVRDEEIDVLMRVAIEWTDVFGVALTEARNFHGSLIRTNQGISFKSQDPEMVA